MYLKDCCLVKGVPSVIQGLRPRRSDFLARRLRPIRRGSAEDEQRPPHHVAGSTEWMVRTRGRPLEGAVSAAENKEWPSQSDDEPMTSLRE